MSESFSNNPFDLPNGPVIPSPVLPSALVELDLTNTYLNPQGHLVNGQPIPPVVVAPPQAQANLTPAPTFPISNQMPVYPVYNVPLAPSQMGFYPIEPPPQQQNSFLPPILRPVPYPVTNPTLVNNVPPLANPTVGFTPDVRVIQQFMNSGDEFRVQDPNGTLIRQYIEPTFSPQYTLMPTNVPGILPQTVRHVTFNGQPPQVFNYTPEPGAGPIPWLATMPQQPERYGETPPSPPVQPLSHEEEYFVRLNKHLNDIGYFPYGAGNDFQNLVHYQNSQNGNVNGMSLPTALPQTAHQNTGPSSNVLVSQVVPGRRRMQSFKIFANRIKRKFSRNDVDQSMVPPEVSVRKISHKDLTTTASTDGNNERNYWEKALKNSPGSTKEARTDSPTRSMKKKR